jgi:signal transduction histidine kinase/CheY-like chemotaxis protein
VVGLGIVAVLAWLLWRGQRDYAIELAEQVRQITEERELTERAVHDRDLMASESQAKSEMLATLSREIRAHLNGIIGSADLMLDHPLKPQQRAHLGTLRASAESLHQSLNDVLDYSSIETGQIQIASAPFDLREPLITVVESLSPLALLKKLELVLIVAADVPLHVAGDAARVRQILFNLMSNAVKFTARGRVVLRVELSPGSIATSKQGGIWLHFSVSDTGAGIPENLQSTIFDRTAGADVVSARKSGGSGLELAISKRLVELMGGQIGARSLPEGGSEFWTVLALSVAKEQLPASTAVADRRHVVVLDNLAASRIAASALLARVGVNHDSTDSVAKAAVLLREALEEGAAQLTLLLDESFARDQASGLASLLAPGSPLRATRFVLMSQNPEALPAVGVDVPITAVVRKPLLRGDVLLEALRAEPGAAVRPAGSRTPFDASGESAAATRHGPHVLVVDDDAISRSVSSQLLERLGCVVEVALSGTEAVGLARGSTFDLIFMDCQMPEMDGFVATEKIRAAVGNKAPPIVALTANISEADRERCFAVGMCDFVGKPVNRTELARVLKRWTKPAAVSGVA